MAQIKQPLTIANAIPGSGGTNPSAGAKAASSSSSSSSSAHSESNKYGVDASGTGPLARLRACSLAPLIHSLAPPCLLRSRAPHSSFICTLAHSFTPELLGMIFLSMNASISYIFHPLCPSVITRSSSSSPSPPSRQSRPLGLVGVNLRGFGVRQIKRMVGTACCQCHPSRIPLRRCLIRHGMARR